MGETCKQKECQANLQSIKKDLQVYLVP